MTRTCLGLICRYLRRYSLYAYWTRAKGQGSLVMALNVQHDVQMRKACTIRRGMLTLKVLRYTETDARSIPQSTFQLRQRQRRTQIVSYTCVCGPGTRSARLESSAYSVIANQSNCWLECPFCTCIPVTSRPPSRTVVRTSLNTSTQRQGT